MGFFSKLAGLGLLAGAATAGVLIGRKYVDNKLNEKAEMMNAINLDSVENAATANTKANITQDIKKAASDVLDDAKSVVYQKADNLGINTTELTSTVCEASKAIADASKVIAGQVYDKTPLVVDKVKAKTQELMGNSSPKTYVEPITEIATDVNDEVLNEEVADILTIAEEDMK